MSLTLPEMQSMTIGVLTVTTIMRMYRRLNTKQHAILNGTTHCLTTLLAYHAGNVVCAIIYGFDTAFYVWIWWRNGGGDDTKRRLRDVKKRFEGVRRTAPVTT